MDHQATILDAEFFSCLRDATKIFLDQPSDRQGFISKLNF
jgi:hypothetical protein